MCSRLRAWAASGAVLVAATVAATGAGVAVDPGTGWAWSGGMTAWPNCVAGQVSVAWKIKVTDNHAFYAVTDHHTVERGNTGKWFSASGSFPAKAGTTVYLEGWQWWSTGEKTPGEPVKVWVPPGCAPTTTTTIVPPTTTTTRPPPATTTVPATTTTVPAATTVTTVPATSTIPPRSTTTAVVVPPTTAVTPTTVAHPATTTTVPAVTSTTAPPGTTAAPPTVPPGNTPLAFTGADTGITAGVGGGAIAAGAGTVLAARRRRRTRR